MKITCFLIESWQEEILRKEFSENQLVIFSEPLNTENIKKINDAEILVSRARFLSLKFDKRTLEQLPNLKFIATMSTGFDHIDLNYCKEKGILVSNVSSYGEVSVTEQTFALLLSISKKIPQSTSYLKNISSNPKELIGIDLNSKILGIIGTGKIGLNIIKIAKGFGMSILAYDIYQNYKASEELDFKYVELEELLKNSDIISLHTSLNDKTFHLIGEKEFSLLKSNAIIINTARGELIDTLALIDYLKKNPNAFAGIDVFEGESDSFQENTLLQELLKLKNVIITPHNASNTSDAKRKILQTTIENIKNFINNQPKNLL